MSSRKAALYRHDTYFREGRHAFRALADDVAALTLLLLKPDALVSGRLRSLFDRVVGHAFTPLYAEAVTFDRMMFRALWWYQHNAVTIEHLAVMNQLVCATPSVLVLFRDDRHLAGARRPASVRLTSLKGPADPTRQEPGQLRHGQGAPNSMFTLVHTPDEPIDVLRELAILLDEERRKSIIPLLTCDADQGNQARHAMDALIYQLELRYPGHDLDPEASRRRLRAAGIPPDASVEELIDRLAGAEHATRWDLFSVISQRLRSRRAGEAELVDNVPPHAWDDAGRRQPPC